MPILRPHAARFHEPRISSVTLTSAHLYGNVYIPEGVARALADSFDFAASGGAKFTKMWDSLPWMPMNRGANCDAASFILGGEIRNRTNTCHKKTNSNRYIPTLPIDTCVDNEIKCC